MLIRRIEQGDKRRYLEMVQAFYASDAVLECIPEESILATFDEMMRSKRYVEGFLMLADDGKPAGYGLVAKSFSQEAGGKVLWVEELFILPEYRSQGLGSQFMDFLRENLSPDVKRVRMEVEEDKAGAMSLYHKRGFEQLPYMQMILDPEA